MDIDLTKIITNKDITDLEYKVLVYIIENIDNAIDMGVRGIAKENYTSTSTVMRLSKKLGYTGFLDMVYNITQLLGESKNTNKSLSFINGINLPVLLKYIDENDIDECIKALHESKNKLIFLYAKGFSKIMAEYMEKKMLTLGFQAILCDSIGIFESNIDNMGLLIVISKSGETEEVLDKVVKSKERGKKIISFTNEFSNSIQNLSTINFKIYDMHKLDDRNVRPNTFFASTLVLIEYIIYRYNENYLKDNNI